MKDDNRAMFKSMDMLIMQIYILIDEMLERLCSEAIMEAALPFLHFVSTGEIERFRRVLLKLRDILDAEASVEWWIIDDLRLGKVKGLIFEDEQLPRSDTSKEVLKWWRQLRPALETAKDVLDEICVNASISEKEGFHIFTNRHKQRRRFFSDYSMNTVTGVITRVWKILNDSIILKPLGPKRRIDERSVDRSHVIVGRQDDVSWIVELLMSNAHCETTSASPNVSVIPILGDSGLGKTTLAKLVYSDHRVEKHFDKKMWVSFSNCYVSIFECTKSLLQSSTVGEEKLLIDGKIFDILQSLLQPSTVGEKKLLIGKKFDILQSLLHSSLVGKKFLLVLDGVPNEICCDWDLLHVPLMAGEIGSRILVTTRSSHVSSTLGTVPHYNLQPLSFEDCWLLFTRIAYRDNTSGTPSPLQLRCYKEMVEWFQGFPSLVIALSEFSHFNPNEKEIKAALVEVRLDHNSHISSALLRTYHSLSSLHVKQCFLYCALLPKNFRFQRHKLVWLWMAEGFLQSKGSMTMEEVGFSYFEELLQASFIKCKSCDYFVHHDSSSYIIPDLAQYLLKYMCGKEYLRIDNDKTCFSEYTRHLSLCFEADGYYVPLRCKGVSGNNFDFPQQSIYLQTLLLLGESSFDNRSRFKKHIEKLTHDIHNFTRLRVLDISYTSLLEVPDSICNLKHLRFLDISGNNLKCLPQKISMLHNLQTLIIEGPNKVPGPNKVLGPNKLPLFLRGVEKLVSLRHLIFGNGYDSYVLPHGFGKLTNLQTLPTFVVGHENDESGIEELKELKYLQGSLALLRLENVSQEKTAQGLWLVDKAHLKKLEFVWYDMKDPEISENLLLNLKPHTNLKHLEIVNYGGLKFPTWMGCPSFSNLESIRLYACETCESLPPLGQLPSLKSLSITMMLNVKYIDDGFLGNHMDEAKTRFKSLKFLKLEALSCLEKWTGLGDGDMPNLEELEISCCDMLISLPTFKFLCSLKRLSIATCSKLELSSEEGLPEESLDSLYIWRCPLLPKRYRREDEGY